MRVSALLLALSLAAPTFAATINNDDSCDIALQPAATLLLPYFEVDFKSPQSQATTTLFTIENVSNLPQIVNVTLWTDWAYPGMNFPIFLTGYDVAPINLYDIFARGVVVVNATPANTIPTNPTPGSQPLANDANPNFLPDAVTACANVPGPISFPLLTDIQLIFTTGKSTGNAINCPLPSGGQAQVGGVHEHAIGYITLDVVATCSAKNASSAGYFDGTVLFDNVLIGDYQQIVPRAEKSYAQGGPMVQIRAIPEGGAAGSVVATNLPYTFYDRYTKVDRRQPLPSTFAPRYIQGGTGGFNTSYKIWREGVATTGCSSYAANGTLSIADVIRFDEHENATALFPSLGAPVPPIAPWPATSSVPVSAAAFPLPSTSGDVAGWSYLNLNANTVGKRTSQNWIITSMFAEPAYATEATAVALGNGCTPATAIGARIGPAKNVNP